MFTGIIEEIGKIKSITKSGHTLQIVIIAKTVIKDIKLGDSIAVNGVCLTVTKFDSHSFSVDVMPVTFYSTNLSKLFPNSQVNLERAMAANGRFGGHMVSGHVDGIAKILSIKTNENAIIYTIELKSELSLYCIEKGSISIDGTSLTIFEIKDKKLSVSLIPHTQKHSILGFKKIGELVNIECDMILKSRPKTNNKTSIKDSKISKNYLAEHGFIH